MDAACAGERMAGGTSVPLDFGIDKEEALTAAPFLLGGAAENVLTAAYVPNQEEFGVSE